MLPEVQAEGAYATEHCQPAKTLSVRTNAESYAKKYCCHKKQKVPRGSRGFGTPRPNRTATKAGKRYKEDGGADAAL